MTETKIIAPSLASLEGCNCGMFVLPFSYLCFCQFSPGNRRVHLYPPASGVLSLCPRSGRASVPPGSTQSYTHNLFSAIPSCGPCCSFQESIYSLLAVVIKWVSLIVFDLNQFSLWIFCSSHIQRPHGINSAVMSHLSEYK